MRLQDRVAVVTGGGRGIGEAVALALAEEGARLALASRTKLELERVAEEIHKRGGQVQPIPTDVSRHEEVARLVEGTIKSYGQIDILVNAAGVYGPIGPLWEVGVEAWTHAVQINLIGTFLCCRTVLPYMIDRRRGKIINFSGGGATTPLPMFTAYGVSKTAVVRLTETLAEEVKEFNIQVNAISPGAVNTRLQDDVLAAGEQAGAMFERIRHLRTTGEGGVPPDLAARLAVFLASEQSDGLTGKLVAAPYDEWDSWDVESIGKLMAAPWLTLRRVDRFTLQPLLGKLAGGETF
jgi:NAD(P)-dependent dehydrogenase (short-subunit alcohol dehydrogenase family)